MLAAEVSLGIDRTTAAQWAAQPEICWPCKLRAALRTPLQPGRVTAGAGRHGVSVSVKPRAYQKARAYGASLVIAPGMMEMIQRELMAKRFRGSASRGKPEYTATLSTENMIDREHRHPAAAAGDSPELAWTEELASAGLAILMASTMRYTTYNEFNSSRQTGRGCFQIAPSINWTPPWPLRWISTRKQTSSH